jgi:sulfonate transport system permease protein
MTRAASHTQQADPPATHALVQPMVKPSREPSQKLAFARRAFLPLALVAAWAAATTSGWVPPSILPSPSDLVTGFQLLWSEQQLTTQLLVSLTRAAVGGAIGVSIGLILGITAGLSRLGEEFLDSFLQMLRTIPFLALVPLFIVWFGVGEFPKLLLIIMATMFPMYLNAYGGVRNVDRKLLEAMRSFGLTGFRLVREVVIPSALPQIFTGLRYSLGVSVLVLIAAEQINTSQGLGYLLNSAQLYQQVDVILICIAIYALLGLSADLITRSLEKIFMPWRVSVAAR